MNQQAWVCPPGSEGLNSAAEQRPSTLADGLRSCTSTLVGVMRSTSGISVLRHVAVSTPR